MTDAYIVDGVRTAVGSIGGGLSEVRADDLAAHVISELVRRHSTLDTSRIEDVILGNANQAGDDNRNVARMALLLAGLPVTVPGETVNRLCASGMSAVANAARAVALGEGDFYIAGGVENMTRAPYVMSKASKPFARDIELFDTSLGWRFVNPRMKATFGVDSMGQTAENVAEQYGVSRDDQDRFALRSQQRATAARAAGRFIREIVPVDIPQKKGDPKRFDEDEFIRPDTTLEILARLKPAFRPERGSVTAGNSSGLNDGAAALLVASEAGVEQLDIPGEWLARLRHHVRRASHVLDAPSDIEVSLAEHDRPRRIRHRAHSRRAQTIHRFAWDRNRKAGEQQRHSGDVAIVITGLVGVSENDVANATRVERRMSPHQLRDHVRGEIVGADLAQSSTNTSDGGSNAVDDICVGHSESEKNAFCVL